MLYDHRGNPVRTADLKREIAESTGLTGVRNPWRDAVATGLTPTKLAELLAAADDGDITDYLALAEELEERDGHYYSQMQTRKGAVVRLEVALEAPSDSANDVAWRDELEERLIKQPMFRGLMFDALDGLGKGFSVVETLWDTSAERWWPREFKWRDPRFFQLDAQTGEVLALRDPQGLTTAGIPLPAFKFITHRPKLKSGLAIRGGLARKVAALHVFKAYALMDWMSFCEVYGIPLRIGKYGPEASEGDITTLKRAVANLGSDAAAVIPDSMAFEIVEAAGRGSGSVHQVLEEWLNKEISKIVLGQTMASEDGASLSQAQVHNEVRKDIRDFDALQLEETLNRDLIGPLTALNLGATVEPPKLRLVTEEPEDLQAFTESFLPWAKAGVEVEKSVIRDKWGLEEPAEGADVVGAPPAPASEGDGGEEAESEEGDDLNAAVRTAAVHIMRQVQLGKTISADQRLVLAQAFGIHTHAANDERDTVDELVDEALDDWQRIMDPVLAPIIELANSAGSLEEMSEKLETLTIDTRKLTESLAVELFKARGLGDARDKV
jgi:phage gp29-like protein